MGLEGTSKDWAERPEEEDEYNFQLTQYFVLPNEPPENENNSTNKEDKLREEITTKLRKRLSQNIQEPASITLVERIVKPPLKD